MTWAVVFGTTYKVQLRKALDALQLVIDQISPNPKKLRHAFEEYGKILRLEDFCYDIGDLGSHPHSHLNQALNGYGIAINGIYYTSVGVWQAYCKIQNNTVTWVLFGEAHDLKKIGLQVVLATATKNNP